MFLHTIIIKQYNIFAMLKVWIFLTIIAYAYAFQNFVASDTKKDAFKGFISPITERFFAPQFPTAPSTKAITAPFTIPYLAPYAYPAQYLPSTGKQFPYYPYSGAFYPPQQQHFYPGPIGPSIIYVQRYPIPAEGSEQGGTTSGSGWGFPTNWQQWSNFNFPNFFGGSGSSEAEGSTPGTPAEIPQGSSSVGSKEKIENTEAAEELSQDSKKTQTERNVLGSTGQQQYLLFKQPQFDNQFAAYPYDRDPASLNGATKGAVSSFLFYKDENQQIAPQKPIEISNVPVSASVAYQRFLLLSKQRPEETIKQLPNESDSSDNSRSVTPAEIIRSTRSEFIPSVKSTGPV